MVEPSPPHDRVRNNAEATDAIKVPLVGLCNRGGGKDSVAGAFDELVGSVPFVLAKAFRVTAKLLLDLVSGRFERDVRFVSAMVSLENDALGHRRDDVTHEIVLGAWAESYVRADRA